MEFVTNFIYSIVRISTPLIFIALCSTISEQAGLMNMAAESMMLVAALVGVAVSGWTQSVWLGILAGALSSVVVVLFLCFATFKMKVDLYLMSIAMNMSLQGATVMGVYLLTGTKATTSGVVPSLALGSVDIPIIKDIPFIGAILSGHNLFTYIGLAMTVVVWYLLFKTKIGLRIRAVGRNPQACESVGINPRLMYTLAFVLAAAIGSFGGMYLSMGYQQYFYRNITAGKGFVGMSASSIANAQPFGALVVSLIFGVAYAIANNLTTVISNSYVLNALPFLLVTVVYLLISAYRTNQDSRKLKNRKKAIEKMDAQSREN